MATSCLRLTQLITINHTAPFSTKTQQTPGTHEGLLKYHSSVYTYVQTRSFKMSDNKVTQREK